MTNMANVTIANLTSSWTDPTRDYTGLGLNITATSYDPSSKVFKLKVNGNTIFSVDASGTVSAPTISIANAVVDIASPFNKANAAFNVANAAFDSSNTEYTFSNSIYAAVNSAFGVINAAFASANNVAPQVAPAFGAANQAGVIANSAFGAANQAGVIANAAFGAANQSGVIANGAFVAANQSGVIANAAFAAANNLSPQISPTFNAANQAGVIANSAFSAANQSGVIANGAFGAANQSGVIANAAFGAANQAGVIANAAFLAQNNQYTFTNVVYAAVNSSFVAANQSGVIANGAFVAANQSGVIANGAFGAANQSGVIANGAFGAANQSGVIANAAFGAANQAGVIANVGFNQANTARDRANDAYGLAQQLGGNAANSIVTNQASFNTANGAFAAANSISVSANNYAGVMANSANAWANTKVSSVTGTSGRITSSGGTTPAIDLSTAGAGAATYSSGISSISVDAYGRVTSVSGSANYTTGSGYLPLSGGSLTGTLSANSNLFVTPQNGVEEGGEISLIGAGSYSGWTIDSYLSGLRFFTGGLGTQTVSMFNSNGGANNVNLYVQGALGVGTSSPSAKLQVSDGAIMPSAGSTSSSGIQWPSDPGGGSGDSAFIRYYAVTGESTKFQIGTDNDADDTIALYQAGADRLTVYNGNIGIATATPSQKLHVQGTGFASNDFRAPIFYNSNDTNSYWDGGSLVLRNANPTVYFRDTDGNSAAIHCNSNLLYVLRGNTDTTSMTTVNGVWPFYINLLNNDATFGGSVYAPIYYDSNDTSTYLNPSGTSVLGSVIMSNMRPVVDGWHTTNDAKNRFYFANNGRTYFGSQNGYEFRSAADVNIASIDNTGAMFLSRASAGYDSGDTNSFQCSNWFRSSGSTGWYNGTHGGGIYMEDSTWVRVYNNKQFYSQNFIQSDSSVRAPIFYDSNDTNFYVDPNGTSVLNSVSFNSGYGSSAPAYAVRAWVSFNGTNGTIFASQGVTSVTRNTTGDYRVNFNFTMPDANYAVSGAGMEDNGQNSGGSYQTAFSLKSSTSTTTTSCGILNANVDQGDNKDGARIMFMAVR